MSEIGDNANAQLRSIVERIERLEEDKRAVASDIKDVYSEAKGAGYDVKALRTAIRLRRMDANERDEQEALLATYMHALGMAADMDRVKASLGGAA